MGWVWSGVQHGVGVEWVWSGVQCGVGVECSVEWVWSGVECSVEWVWSGAHTEGSHLDWFQLQDPAHFCQFCRT